MYVILKHIKQIVLGVINHLYFKMWPVCPSVCAFNPLPSDSRLRCCDRYIRCHRLLAVKPLSPREHEGRRVGKGGTLGSVHRASSDLCGCSSPWSRV